MMRFMLGVAIGATAYWAYEKGWLPFTDGHTVDQVMSSADSEIIRPTPHEVSSRPAEPIPSA